MINCNKAGQMIEQHQYDKLSWWGRRKLRFHISMCKLCRHYDEDNEVLSKVIKMAGPEYSDKCISDDEKAKMKDHLAKNHS